ncbi:MAG: Sec-independent protein translocase protein TatB [Candidatus Magnetominusculus sp. LBB02]|nr:Sec-independent protein translocase protein TatB [Candidatus Magnetominusculus sp. LBB02]
MFDIGLQEIVLIFVIALIVYGPKDLPELGRKVGRYIFMFKRMINDVKRQMDAELYEYTEPIKTEMEKISIEASASSKPQSDVTQEAPASEASKAVSPAPETSAAVNPAAPTSESRHNDA